MPLAVNEGLVSSPLCGAYAASRKRGPSGCTSPLCPTDCMESSAVRKEIRFQLPDDSSCLPDCLCTRQTRRADGRRVRVVLRPAAASSLSGPLRFIVDSGSCFDIANMKECTRRSLARVIGLDPPLEMSTVNGRVTVTKGLRIEVPALKKGVDFALMPNSPSIISLGRRCMLDGYAFHWPAGTSPYLIDPSGQRIDLEVDNYSWPI